MGGGSDKTFDLAERELSRKKLIRYAKENGIGAGRLAKRIKAADPRETEIPVSTLQRFLGNLMRTNEPAVRLCYRFAESLVVSDSSAALGERLFVFYGAGNGRDYSGTYRSEIRTADVAQMEFAGHSEINIAADTGFWRVTEKTAPDLNHAIYDGVLVCSGDAAVVVLKDRVAGVARNYMLWPESETLQGHGAAMRFLPGDTTEVWDKFKISGIEPIEIRLRKI
ncbi:MAG: hypothetical protein M3178_00190 [Pseudomonadota bacterium]|nr:hypothetical protein [Pseudomonadota bacterium]